MIKNLIRERPFNVVILYEYLFFLFIKFTENMLYCDAYSYWDMRFWSYRPALKFNALLFE